MRLLGISKSEIMSAKQFREFSSRVGVDLSSGLQHQDEEGFSSVSSNHPAMRCIDIARNSRRDLRYAYAFISPDLTFYEVQHLDKEYARFKKFNGLLDFTDMMVRLAERPQFIPKFRAAFLDEAQDLTPLQWEVALHIAEKSDRMYIAGDDDQGIYRWAGADTNRFASLDGGSEVLSQSHRVPRSIWKIADKAVQRIQHRQKKIWSPRPEEGSVSRHYDEHQIEFERDDEWLVLAQANFMLDNLAEHMKMSGIYFERRGEPSLKKGLSRAIHAWQHLSADSAHEITVREAQNLYDHIASGEGGIERGAKKRLSRADEKEMLSFPLLRQEYGLRCAPNDPWDTALSRVGDAELAYAHALMSRGIDIFKAPRIKLSTIHGSKGGEADNVLLFLDLTGRAIAEMERNPDDANRVLYVGLTRARENLVLKYPEDQQRGWAI